MSSRALEDTAFVHDVAGNKIRPFKQHFTRGYSVQQISINSMRKGRETQVPSSIQNTIKTKAQLEEGNTIENLNFVNSPNSVTDLYFLKRDRDDITRERNGRFC